MQAALPPRHWPPAVLQFLRGPGRSKVLFATNFPTVVFNAFANAVVFAQALSKGRKQVAGRFARELVEGGGDGSTGCAPLGPEVHHQQLGVLAQFSVEAGLGEMERAIRH
jgi:hypothetical protein